MQARNRNPQIAEQTLKPKQIAVEMKSSDEQDQAKMDAKIKRKQEYKNLPEMVAQSRFYYRNWLWDLERKCFPHEPRLRHVDLYFPKARGGPLLIDIPVRDWDKNECEGKRKFMAQLGYRYLMLHAGITLEEAMTAFDNLGVANGVGHTTERKGRPAEDTERRAEG